VRAYASSKSTGGLDWSRSKSSDLARPKDFGPHRSITSVASRAVTPGASALTASDLLYLQRTIGNRRVGELLRDSTTTTSATDQAVQVGIADPGRALDQPVLAEMESRFGHDFSGVRLHTDARADTSAQALDARAYTVGQDVVFATGQYAPHTEAGRQVLAHELAHTMQQGSVPSATRQHLRVSRPADESEREAELAAQSSFNSPSPLTPVQPHVQRQTATAEVEPQGPGPATKGAGDVSVYVGRTMTAEAALREIYQQGSRSITQEAIAMVERGGSVSDAARWANEARNDLKLKIRVKGSPITRGLAEARNMRKYGNKVGPTYDDLIRQGKTPEDIIGSAGRANTKLTKVATKLRVAGRLLIAVDIAIVTWEVLEAPEGEGLKTAVEGAGGIGGALGGGWAGAKGGAFVGSFFGPWGTAIGGAIGGVGGALGGAWTGRKVARTGYEFVEELFAPNLDGYMSDIDAAEQAAFREAAAQIRGQLREIEERSSGPEGRREYVAPGGGRIPEY